MTERTFSGVQPTGDLHLGNYLGAVKRFAALQGERWSSLFCIVDLHAITVPQDPDDLLRNTRTVAAAFIAAGVNPDHSVIFNQSRVRQHTELAWILNCTARVGWLERMTQFKDKAGENAERESVGLYAYPVLMAADILLYKATQVPVGEDQRQHLELARDIAHRFNRDHLSEIENVTGKIALFPLPRGLVHGGAATRVMSLQDATKKMSKSDPNRMATIHLTDDADTIATKVKRAQSDSLSLPDCEEGLENRPAARNLVGILAAVTGVGVDDVLREFEGRGFADLKRRLTEALTAEIVPVGTSMRKLLDDTPYIDHKLRQGAEHASLLAEETMREVRAVMGFL